MKTLILIRMIVTAVASLVLAFNVHAGGEMKKVCHDEKGKQVCKTVKVHKKLESTTKVPPK
jgi:hypothetical protein